MAEMLSTDHQSIYPQTHIGLLSVCTAVQKALVALLSDRCQHDIIAIFLIGATSISVLALLEMCTAVKTVKLTTFVK